MRKVYEFEIPIYVFEIAFLSSAYRLAGGGEGEEKEGGGGGGDREGGWKGV